MSAAPNSPAGGGFNRTMPPSTVIPELVYEDVGEAVTWLCDKFGFEVRWQAADHRAQLWLNGGTVVVTERRSSHALPGPQSLLVRVPDVRAHCQRARERGAKILEEPQDFPYGERQYAAQDLGGHHWGFSESIADLEPEAWGGVSGPALRAPGLLTAAQLSVMLIVADAGAAISWYRDALGATELWNLGGVAGLQIHGAPFFIHQVNPRNETETSPDMAGVTSVRVELFVDDPDAVIATALARGASPGPAIEDHRHFSGVVHRQGGFRDPFGHNWSVGTRVPLSPHGRG
ncbi:MAG TPA: VOC family protein [Solirubrobacteraceae bacterium]|nr:VOC family protein [Solirubrobacteraceae bacterium]